jgi:hypothetical protein
MPRSPVSLAAATLAAPRRLVDRIRWIGGRNDAAFEAAAREAYRAGTGHEVAARSSEQGTSPTIEWAPVGRPTELTARAPIDATDPARNVTASRTANLPEGSVEEPGDALFRTRTSVTPVADDFFDGLIRRVEGER